MPASFGCSSRMKRKQLRPRFLLVDDGVANVGPVELETNTRASSSANWRMISTRVCGSAVAVSAMRRHRRKRS